MTEKLVLTIDASDWYGGPFEAIDQFGRIWIQDNKFRSDMDDDKWTCQETGEIVYTHEVTERWIGK